MEENKKINEDTRMIKILKSPIYKSRRVINPAINLIAGAGLGYTLEKNQIPMYGLSGLDAKLGLGLNVVIGGIEGLTKETSTKEKVEIVASCGIGYGCFIAGNYAGRLLAKLY